MLVFLAALAALYLTLVTHSVDQWVSATLEFWHKEWLLRLQTLHTFDQSDVKTKRQKGKRQKRQKTQKRQKDDKTKRRKTKTKFNIATSGQFRTLAMFLINPCTFSSSSMVSASSSTSFAASVSVTISFCLACIAMENIRKESEIRWVNY